MKPAAVVLGALAAVSIAPPASAAGRTLEAIPMAGAKIRITNSEMIANFAASLKMNPIPLAWSELLEGLK